MARDSLEKPIDKEPLTGDSDDGQGIATKTSHTLVEVPVEVAVAIALASFIVGAMSTGVLWFLHSKAMQAKTVSGLKYFSPIELSNIFCAETTQPRV